jgi:hypothetical protein
MLGQSPTTDDEYLQSYCQTITMINNQVKKVEVEDDDTTM